MKHTIEKYINDISKDKRLDYNTGNDYFSWYFSGDGEGDFEETASKATKQSVVNYIQYCEEQIKLANEYLKQV